MADSSSASESLNETHFKDPKSKFFWAHYLFSKSLMIIFVVLVFTYFPSQVPEYFKKTSIGTKIWDLMYLLVIGIAVCYGLFSTRKVDNLDSCDESVKETYLSGISDISSIFDNGFEEKYVVEELDKAKSAKRNTPLGLPVRSLVSNSGGGSNEFSSDWDEVKKGKFRGLVPIKLEDKFKESDMECDSPRPVLNWRSKSMRVEKREDMCTAEVNGSSVEVGDFEGLKSQSMRFSVPPQMKNPLEKEKPKGVETKDGYMQQPSFMESKPQKFGISGSSEMDNRLSSKDVLNDFGKIKVVEGTMDGSVKTEVVDSTLDSNNNVPFIKPKSQRSSSRVSSDMNNNINSNSMVKDFGKNNVNGTSNGSSKEFLKAVGKTNVDDGIKLDSNNYAPFVKSKSQRSSLGAPSEMNLETFDYVLAKEDKADPIEVDVIPKPAPIANTYKRGKSVRTNRQKEQVLEKKVKTFPSPSNDKVEARMEQGANATDVNHDQYLSDTEPYSSEVDRKADEFIAKFRAQIRLQRVASARKLNLR